MGRFSGIPVDGGGRFGGTVVEQDQAEEKKPYMERVEDRFTERKTEIDITEEAYDKGEITYAESELQGIGKSAGLALDVIGEGLVSAGRGLSYVIPDSIEEPVKQTIKEGFEDLSNTEIGAAALEAVKGGIEKWNEYKEENPRAAKNIESVVNIAVLVAPAKTRAGAEPTVIGKAADKVGKTAAKQIAKKRGKFIQELIEPKRTPKVKISEVPRTVETGRGPFKTSTIKPTPRESQIAAEVSRIKGVHHKKSIQQNYSAISKENTKLAMKLEADVSKSRAIIPVDESVQVIDDAINVIIAENPIIVGNLKTTAIRVANKAKQILKENSPDASGLLKARKEFDSWVRTLPRGDVKLSADAAMESQSIAIKTVRNSMNDLLDARVKSAAVKRELKRQSLLYDALGNITPKAAEEANSAIGRAWQNAFKVLGIRNKSIQSAAAVMGVGGLGAAAKFAPVFTTVAATVGTGAVASKLFMGPQSKIIVGRVLNAIDKAILTSTKPSMIKQLRADRALIVELLENSEIEQDTAE